MLKSELLKPEYLSFGIILGTMALFVWGRFRYDLVAALSLLTAIAAGIVPPDKAFSGFSDDIVIIVASALVVSAAVARSGVIERMMTALSPWVTSTQSQVFVLVTAVTVMSGFVKNIGAVAMLLPVAFYFARRTETSVTHLLMPLAFGSLLGGIVTLVGTSPNIIVSRVREQIVGEPFHMFDFTPVGVGLALAGIGFLTFAYRILPTDRKGSASMDAAFNIEGYITEAEIAADSTVVGKTVEEVETLSEDEVEVRAVIRPRSIKRSPPGNLILKEGHVLILHGEPADLEALVAVAKLKLTREDKPVEQTAPTDDVGVMEAVVGDDSPLIDQSAAQFRLHERYQVNLLAVSRSGRRFSHRLRALRLKAGDVIVLQGELSLLPETLGALRCLPLAKRDMPLGRRRNLLPLAILVVAMVLVAMHVLPIAIAFFGAAVLMLLVGAIPLREVYETIDWPILILLGALIPVSDTLRTTGGTEIIAGFLSSMGNLLPPLAALGLIMIAAMAVTPFLNNAATVLVMAPIAASFASQLNFSPDPFLMAVAIGAGCDFLTPIGHQCNTLVMGPGGYRFSDYWKLGLPLSILVVVAGVPLIAYFWPFVK